MHSGHAPARRRGTLLLTLAVLAAGVAVLSAGIGALAISPAQVASILGRAAGWPALADFDAAQETVLLSIRLPRVLLGLLVGGSLAVAGASMQGLFRNPLADPGLLGVSSGAALAAFAAIVFGGPLFSEGSPLRNIGLPVSAFCGALAALLALYALANDRGRIHVSTLLLAGIAINALCGAGIGLFSFLASDTQLRGFTFWSLGSLGGAGWGMLAVVAPLLGGAALLMLRLAPGLNLLALGESEAAHLGLRVERHKLYVGLLSALMVGIAVSVSGAIGFVGLVVPHILRMLGGPDHRWLLPASVLCGGALLVAADAAARVLVAPAELPIGVLTALTGGPFFMWLLVRSRKRSSWT